MRAHLQRVKRASVEVEGERIGAIEKGLLVLLGVHEEDTDADLAYLVKKTCTLRIFEDTEGKMNLSVEDVGGALLIVSQFTLYADCRKGRRPSFVSAMAPEPAQAMVDRFVDAVKARGLSVETGRFGADMQVELINDGPVTILLESPQGR